MRVQYDPSVISYDALLKHFFSLHDASYRRGEDSQYRSIVLTLTEDQAVKAKAYVESVNATRNPNRQLSTQIAPAGPFYRAEEYHQRYYEKMGVSSCRIR